MPTETPAPQKPRVFVAVHRCVPKGPPMTHGETLGVLIDLTTRARFVGEVRRWSFPDGPATHAFVVGDEYSPHSRRRWQWRLDALPPTAILCTYDPPPEVPTRLWELTGNVAGAAEKARALIGTPYDLSEMLNQSMGLVKRAEGIAAAVAGALVHRLGVAGQAARSGVRFPFGPGRGLPINYSSVEGACICTALSCLVMQACGGFCEELARQIMTHDFFPEEVTERCAGKLPEVDAVTLEPMA